MRYNIKTRHPKKRPTHIRIGTALPDGTTGTAQIPVAEHPTMLFVYKFAEPTILRCFPPDVENFKWLPIAISSHQELNDFAKNNHWDLRAKVRVVPEDFARMLAKIAYSYTIAELGLGSFRPAPLLLDVILGRTTNVAYVVGGDWEIPPPDPRGVHLLQMTCRVATNGALIIIEIRLFPAFETPHYRVVVGEFDFQRLEHVTAFNKMMGKIEAIHPLPPNPSFQGTPASGRP